MAKALGGCVTQNSFKEMGWGNVTVPENKVARSWFDDISEFETFHWHGETFSLPENATCILSSSHCENQAFAMGIHLGMQCHVEMTERMVKDWSDVNFQEIIQMNEPAVQSPSEMEKNLTERVTKLNTVADCLYAKWISALK
jgi:GMP synthase-like glutamine amidotransferase